MESFLKTIARFTLKYERFEQKLSNDGKDYLITFC